VATSKVPDTFARAEVRRILKITENRLRSWERMGLYEHHADFGFADLIALKALQKLRENRIPNERIKRSLTSLTEKLSGIERPLWELKIISDGRKVAVELPGGKMEALSGQMLFNFEASSLKPVTALKKEETRPETDLLAEAEQLFRQGLDLEEAGEPVAKVVETYKQALKLNPKAAGAWVNIGTIRYREGRLGEAERCYREALLISPSYALAHFNLGNVCEELDRLGEAVNHYKIALSLQSDYSDVYYNLALVHERMGEPMQAAKQWQAYLQLDSSGPWAGIARQQLNSLLKITPGGRSPLPKKSRANKKK
jgi:tetratricopeptide (TPR) repeat protein